MPRTEEEILACIHSFEPQNGNWRALDTLLDELWQHPPKLLWVKPLFSIFERFPDEDGAGVFWSIIHGVETIDGYEDILLISQQERPCELKEVMLTRIANSNKRTPESDSP
ncbi:MAG TPA: hypothetical protein VGH19_03565 [Verrucomicrobiae bacterium]